MYVKNNKEIASQMHPSASDTVTQFSSPVLQPGHNPHPQAASTWAK